MRHYNLGYSAEEKKEFLNIFKDYPKWIERLCDCNISELDLSSHSYSEKDVYETFICNKCKEKISVKNPSWEMNQDFFFCNKCWLNAEKISI